MAKITVRIRPKVAPHRFPATSEWWLNVTLQPEANSKSVLNSGRAVASRGTIPVGGQATANSKVGERALWKYAQKIEKKTRTSVPINIVIPWLSARLTSKVWSPARVASRAMSRHQNPIVRRRETSEKLKLSFDAGVLLKKATAQIAVFPREREEARGQTEAVRRWKG